MGELHFRTDLFRGAAAHYERYRLPYPAELVAAVVRHAEPSGHGRLLDLACGTGQLTFPLRPWFAEIWSVDSEPDMIAVVRAKADAATTDAATTGAATTDAAPIRPVVSSAETLTAGPASFELAVIGNAFHRLNRDLVAARILGWLQPGGHLALCWSTGPTTYADAPWQRALADTLARWQAALGATDRVPANWDQLRRDRPDTQVLSEAGFEPAERQEFLAEHTWTVPELAGYVRSTSFLPPSVLGDQAGAFDADLAASLAPYSPFSQNVSFACEIPRKPGHK